jgi:hypothetical protein
MSPRRKLDTPKSARSALNPQRRARTLLCTRSWRICGGTQGTVRSCRGRRYMQYKSTCPGSRSTRTRRSARLGRRPGLARALCRCTWTSSPSAPARNTERAYRALAVTRPLRDPVSVTRPLRDPRAEKRRPRAHHRLPIAKNIVTCTRTTFCSRCHGYSSTRVIEDNNGPSAVES